MVGVVRTAKCGGYATTTPRDNPTHYVNYPTPHSGQPCRVADQGVVVADTLEELARKALALGWFDPSGAGLNLHKFGGTKSSNADTIRSR